MAPMALSDSKVNNDKSCSKTCLTNYEALKKQYDDLLVKLDDTGFKAATYKRGLATLEDQIVKYREHEVLFSEEIALLKRSVGSKEYQMGLLRAELEKVKQEKEGFKFKIAKSDEGSLKLNELTNLVTKLSERIGVLEDDLKKTKQTYSSAFTKLILMIKKLESKVKTGKARVVLSEDEEYDSSKQGRINEDPNTYFAQDDEVVHDQDTAAERQLEDSTAGITDSTAPINISTARESPSTAGRVVYGRRSKEARKDKGKEIMTEPEPMKKSKKLLEQERQGLKEAIRLQKQVDEEEKAQIARDEEITRQLLALDEERVTTDPKTTKDIDWNDPLVQKYWNMKNKPKSEAQARKNMIVYLKNQRIEKEKKKPAEFQVEEIEKDTTRKRKKSLPRKGTRSTTKRQKVELDDEKEDLKGYLDIVLREEIVVDVDLLSTKYPIVDWKTYTLSENFMYYKIIRGDGSSKNYKILSEMLYDFDRQDIVELYMLVKERYSSSKPEGYDLMLWGDLHILFEPDEESEIWMNQNEYNLISWSLCNFCRVHNLLMQNGIAIDMLTEKKDPLRMNAASSVRRPMNRDSHVKNSVLANSKNSAKKVAVYVRKNKQTDNTSANVISNKENVNDVNVANAAKAKNLLCVSCMQNVLIPCHDKCLAKYKLNVHSNDHRALSTNSRTPTSSDTTYVVLKTRFSEKLTQSKSLDTTSVVSKPKIDVGSASNAKHKVVQIVLWIVDSGCSKHMTGDRSLLRNFIKKFMGTIRFGNDNFAAITGYGDYIHGNITICHVHYVEGLGHTLFSVGQFCDGDLEVAFRSKTCYVRNLEGDDLLVRGRESNLYTISISDMAASFTVCLMSKATSTKSWLWHRRLSHLNSETINDLTRLDLVDGLPKFKYGKDHLCSACE
ncbi:integrase, catalytic region, zinc finger, CCHC-type containing protein [Tanacetum coccineum]